MYAVKDDLTTFVHDEAKVGRNGSGEPVEYIPSSALRQYWNETRLRDAFLEYDLHENSDEISNKFLRVFSILVYIGEPRAIERFRGYARDDHSLPVKEFPSDWLKLPNTGNIYQSFLEHQWMFCPLEFSSDFIHKRHLPTPMILPVASMDPLCKEHGDGDVAIVYRVRIDSRCKDDIPNVSIIFFDGV